MVESPTGAIHGGLSFFAVSRAEKFKAAGRAFAVKPNGFLSCRARNIGKGVCPGK